MPKEKMYYVTGPGSKPKPCKVLFQKGQYFLIEIPGKPAPFVVPRHRLYRESDLRRLFPMFGCKPGDVFLDKASNREWEVCDLPREELALRVFLKVPGSYDSGQKGVGAWHGRDRWEKVENLEWE